MARSLHVLLTGAGSGIGLAIAREFLAANAKVWICDASASALAQALEENGQLRGGVADVANAEQVAATCAAAVVELGQIDVLINNAGVPGPTTPTEDVTLVDWQRCLAVNVTGMFLFCQALIPQMKRRKSGVILNISTSSVRTSLPNRTPYVVSKAAVHGLTANLARELGPFGIRCNAILPGPIDNARGRRLIEQSAHASGISVAEAERKSLGYVSMRSWIDPAEVGKMAVFLASDGAAHVSGQFVGVCGNTEWDS